MVTPRTGNPNGRPKKPAALAILHGDRGAKRLTGAVPTGTVEKPTTMSDHAATLWDQIAPDLIRVRIIGPTDVPAFVELLEAMVLAKFYRANMIKQLNGDAVAPGQTPAVYQYRTLMSVLTSGWAQFGLTPSSRTRIFDAVNGGQGASGNTTTDDLLSG